jgi:hypothetical protein
MSKTTKDQMLDPQILIDRVRGAFRRKTAFVRSVLVSSGAVMVSGTMPKGGKGAIGKKVEIPYFGVTSGFVDNPDGNAVTPERLAQMSEEATVARSSMAVETTAWAQGLAEVDGALGDPHDEGKEQIVEQGVREMDKRIVIACKNTPLVRDIYHVSSPNYLQHREVVRARAMWGDEQNDIVAMVVHSMAEADLAEMTDGEGRPLLIEHQREGQESVKKLGGVPLLISDSAPLDGSVMGDVTAAGTTPPAVTLAGEPSGPWNLIIDIVTGGLSDGTATFRFSVDGGMTYSATRDVPSGGGAIALDDTLVDMDGEDVIDSLVGNNGKTGVTATFANGTYNANNTYTSTANIKCTSLLLQKGAAAFWFNQQRLGMKQDVDILADTDIIAMHLYYCAHRYRRRRNGTRTGVIAIKHNVKNYVGGA